MALTLDKAKAKELRKEVEKAKPQKNGKKQDQEEEGKVLTKFEDYFPTTEEIAVI